MTVTNLEEGTRVNAEWRGNQTVLTRGTGGIGSSNLLSSID
jgi:hypothetical protein